MIVVDASAIAELLLRTPLGLRVEARLFAGRETLHVPHLLDAEIMSVVRRLCRSGDLDAERGGQVLADLLALDVRRHPHADLLERAFALRANLTAYDAVYVALAEALAARLVTCDRRLARTPGHRAATELVA